MRHWVKVTHIGQKFETQIILAVCDKVIALPKVQEVGRCSANVRQCAWLNSGFANQCFIHMYIKSVMLGKLESSTGQGVLKLAKEFN